MFCSKEDFLGQDLKRNAFIFQHVEKITGAKYYSFSPAKKQLLGNLQKRTLNWGKLIVRLLGCNLPQNLKGDF